MSLPSPDMPSSRAELTAALADLASRYAPVDGEHPMAAIPALHFLRYSTPGKEQAAFAKASLIFAAQGAKTVFAGKAAYHYDTEHCLLTSIDMPVTGRVEQASRERPYLCFYLEIDLRQVAELVAAHQLPPPDAPQHGVGISAGELPLDVLEAAYRLAKLLDTPKHIPVLAPLIEREILYRLLMSSQGLRLRQALVAESRTFKVSRAVEWIKAHYDAPLRIEELVRHANMSVSSLHQHFKQATGLSPLQYQKRLRLFAARSMMLKQTRDVAVVAGAVGYDNLSQFHREYKRLFGFPPLQDANRLRGEST